MATNNRRNQSSRSHSGSNEGTMSRQEAGHLGGIAPHKCRGRECNEGHQGRSSRSASSSTGRSSSSSNRGSSSSRSSNNDRNNNFND